MRIRAAQLLRGGITSLAADRTNIFSRAYLEAAACGGDFSLMRECIEDPCGRTLAAMLNVGSSSGGDMLSGMCFAAALVKQIDDRSSSHI